MKLQYFCVFTALENMPFSLISQQEPDTFASSNTAAPFVTTKTNQTYSFFFRFGGSDGNRSFFTKSRLA